MDSDADLLTFYCLFFFFFFFTVLKSKISIVFLFRYLFKNNIRSSSNCILQKKKTHTHTKSKQSKSICYKTTGLQAAIRKLLPVKIRCQKDPFFKASCSVYVVQVLKINIYWSNHKPIRYFQRTTTTVTESIHYAKSFFWCVFSRIQTEYSVNLRILS